MSNFLQFARLSSNRIGQQKQLLNNILVTLRMFTLVANAIWNKTSIRRIPMQNRRNIRRFTRCWNDTQQYSHFGVRWNQTRSSWKSQQELRELTKMTLRKESPTHQEKSKIQNDWSEVYGANTYSRWFEAWWIESNSHQKCINSEKCCTNSIFLGCVNHLARILPKVLGTAKPLWDLTCKKNWWQWTDKKQKSFDETKQLLTVQPILSYCDVKNLWLYSVMHQTMEQVEYNA